MRRCIAALLVAAPLAPGTFAPGTLAPGTLAPGTDTRHLHATYYTPNAVQSTIEVALEPPALAPETTRLLEDGHQGGPPASWKEFRATNYGVTAILAVDTSGSVQGAAFESLKAALRDFVSSSRAQDRIAIVSFNDSVDVRQAFTADKAQLAAAIDALHTGGKQTLLNAAIASSLSLLADEVSNPRRHLLVITDGKNEGPGPAMAELTETARKSGIPVDCLGVTRLAVRYLEPMQALALASGGAYLRARGYEQLRQAMHQGIEGLLGSYVLTFHLAHIVPDGRKHVLQVSAPGVSSDAASVFLPAPPKSDVLLYVSIGAAVVLFGIGMMLIHYSRKEASAQAESSVTAEPPPTRQIQPRQARVATVYERNEAIPPSGAAAAPARARQPIVPLGVDPPLPAPALHVSTAPLPKPTEFRRTFPAPATGQPAAWFRLIGQPGATTPVPPPRYPIEAVAVWIGTGEANQIRVKHDNAVSRAHACIEWKGGDLYLLDNHSTNGTVVNGQAMQPGSRIRLQAGDRIVVGESLFSVDSADHRV